MPSFSTAGSGNLRAFGFGGTRGPAAAPSGLSVATASASQLNLSWSNGDATANTQVFREGTLIATLNAGLTTYNDTTGLSSGTTYSYIVRHIKFSILTSANSASASNNTSVNAPSALSVQAVPTSVATPTSLSAVAASPTQINLSWVNADASASIRVLRGGSLVTTLSAGTTTFNDTGLSSATTYSYTVQHSRTQSQINLAWSSGDGTANTQVYRNGSLIANTNVGVTSYSDTGLSGSYTYIVRHIKNSISSSNATSASATTTTVLSSESGAASATTTLSAPTSLSATAKPVSLTAPYALGATAASPSSINLSWTNGDGSLSTQILRAGSVIATASPGTTTYTDSGLASATGYSYTVRHVKTQSQIDLAWTNGDGGASTQILRGGILITTVGVGTTTYSDTGLGATTYSYTVRHIKNSVLSSESGGASATTTTIASAESASASATTTLNAPNSLSALVSTDTSVALSWTNNDSTANTQVFRNGTLIYNQLNSSSVTDTGLTATTQYSYTWRNIKNGVETANSIAVTARPQALFTGGSISSVGGYRVHVFTSTSTLTVSTPGTVEYLVVGGGAGAGGSYGGGGGGGGVVSSSTYIDSNRTATIGAGGGEAVGGNSSTLQSVIEAYGGGSGGAFGENGGSGGSGGGGGCDAGVGGSGTSGQGNGGGNAASAFDTGLGFTVRGGGGGGGKNGSGSSASGSDSGGGYWTVYGGDGGAGATNSWTGTTYTFGSGGGGSSSGGSNGGAAGVGGVGAGNGAFGGQPGNNGTTNLGGGAGGGGGSNPGASGGSGTIIVRYPYV